jgi:hypothetical protein
LRFAVEAQDLAEIVDEARDDEPARLVRAPDGFRGLQGVLDLREVHVRIAVVHQRVEELERFPHGHALPAERQVVRLFVPHEIERLVGVIQAVEFLDGVSGFGREVSEVRGVFSGNHWRLSVLHNYSDQVRRAQCNTETSAVTRVNDSISVSS